MNIPFKRFITDGDRKKNAFHALTLTAILTAGILLPLGNTVNAAIIPYKPVLIKGETLPILSHATKLGSENPNQVLNLAVGLQLQNAPLAQTFVSNLNNKNSSDFHHYLTPAQFSALYSPTQANTDSVKSYLLSQGFKVTSVASNRLLIDVNAPVQTIENTFHISINSYLYKGKTFYANASDPSIPSKFSSVIQSIEGLNSFAVAKAHTLPTAGYVPSNVESAYDIGTLTNAGWTGKNQTIAFFEMDGFLQSDINAYYSNLSIPQPTNTTVLVDSFSGAAGPGAGEVSEDMEMAGGLASSSPQIVYEGPNTSVGQSDTYNKIVTDDKASIISTSWGLCETFEGTASMNTINSTFLQAVAQGQALFSAAGDAGAYDCGDTNLAVDFPSSSPYVTAVGGTNLTLSGSTYSETAWSDPTDTFVNVEGVGGGGGLSTNFSRQSWQMAPGVQNTYSNGNRELPDVAAGADDANGYAIYCTVTAALCASTGWNVMAGTSAGAPLWAASAAIINSYLTMNEASYQNNRIGWFNPTLYSLANTTQQYAPYNDVTTGNNLFYNATSNYDLATGLGSPDVTNIAYDLANNYFVQDTFQRANQTHWGTPTDASSVYNWGGDAASNAIFTINNGIGQVVGGSTTYYAPVAYTNTDVQVLTEGSSSSFSAPSGPNFGAMLCYTSSSNFYRAYIDGSNLILQKDVAGTTTTLSTTAFSATASTNYAIRFQDVAGSLSARVWNATSTEPTTWTSTVSDSSFSPTTGNNEIGLSIQNKSSATTKINLFEAFTPVSSTTSGRATNIDSYISQDNFTRANQSHWGTASDGTAWGADAASNAVFNISGNTGTISSGTSAYNGTLGSTNLNTQAFATLKTSGFSGSANAGLLLRYIDTNNWYNAYIDGTNLIIQKDVASTKTTISTVPFSASATTNYNVKFQIIGEELSAKAWAASAQEPLSWTTTVVDNSLSSAGLSGIRAQDATGVTLTFSLFQSSTVTPTSLGQDTFVRANQSHWGTASDGNAWGADAASNAVFNISGNTGTISGGTSAYNGTLGSTKLNSQIFTKLKVSAFSGGANAGLLLRYIDTNNWYKGYLDGTNLVIQKDVAGTKTTISTVAFAATGGTNYDLLFQINGTELSAKAWNATSAEPTSWTATGVDSALSTAGLDGIRAQDATGVTITYSLFSARSLV